MAEPRDLLKYGCIGCASLAGLIVLSIVVLSGLAVASSTPEEPTEQTLHQDLPAAASPSSLPAAGEVAREAEDTGGAARGISLARLDGLEFPDRGVGALHLDLAMGEFELVPVDGLERIEVDARYDKSRFELEQRFEDTGDGNWSYTVRFGSSPGFGFRGGNNQNHLTIRVPRGRPMSIDGEIEMGASEVELGGLWLQRVDLDMGMGEHRVTFSTPTPMPLELFATDSSMGKVRVRGLGYASPRRVSMQHGMGELEADLDGPWAQDSEIKMRCGMGRCAIDLPEDVHIDVSAKVVMGGRNVRLPDPERVPEGAPTLHLNLRGSMGELQVR